MITAKGDITNMKKRPTFMKESSMASWKDLNFDAHFKNSNPSQIQVTTIVIEGHHYDK
jgi:hypothetical protein